MADPQQSAVAQNNGADEEFSNFLKLLSPVQFGDTLNTAQGNYVEGLFLNFDGNTVWGVYRVRNGEKDRVSMQIDFSEPPRFIMYTHKYFDETKNYHTAISAALPVDRDNPAESMLLAVAVSADTVLRDKEFRIVQPSLFGEIVDTDQGPFIEAFFDDLSPEAVWSIEETISNGNKFKVDFTRRVGLPLAYYLVAGERPGSDGRLITGIRIGLPYYSQFPSRNIEILIKR